MGLNFFEVPRWVVILALFWYLHGWIFPTGTCMGGQKLYTVVHGWAWPHIPWYMDGSLFLQNWYMDGWWVVALQNSQRHTPTQTKVEYPPPRVWNRGYSVQKTLRDVLPTWVAKSASWYMYMNDSLQMHNLVYEWVNFFFNFPNLSQNWPKFKIKFWKNWVILLKILE